MCESKAILIKNNTEETLLNDVILLEKEGPKYILYNIEGKKLVLSEEYTLVKIDFLKHTIFFAGHVK